MERAWSFGSTDIQQEERNEAARDAEHEQQQAQHTPGPWFVNECSDVTAYEIWDEGSRDVVAEVRFRSPEASCEIESEEAANARLIAAAPQMKAAIEIAKQAIHAAVIANPNRYNDPLYINLMDAWYELGKAETLARLGLDLDNEQIPNIEN